MAALTFFLAATPLTASAFCRTTTASLPPSYRPTMGCYTQGIVLYWKNACIGYSVQEDAAPKISLAEATRIIDASFATWSASRCGSGAQVGITSKNLGPVACSTVKYDQSAGNQNVIMFRSDSWPYNDANNTLGLTTVTFNADTGEIYDADMEINAAQSNLTTSDPVPANGFDLQSVVTHEVGHFFGLAHATAPTSTMYAAYRPGTSSLRVLSSDDTDGLCTIYPSTTQRLAQDGVVAAGPCDPTPRRGFSTSCDGTDVLPPPTVDDGGCAASPTAPSRTPPWLVAFGLLALLGGRLARGPRRRL